MGGVPDVGASLAGPNDKRARSGGTVRSLHAGKVESMRRLCDEHDANKIVDIRVSGGGLQGLEFICIILISSLCS